MSLPSVTRRGLIVSAACMALGRRVSAAPDPQPEAETLTFGGHAVEISRYRAFGTGKRPAVLLLHGSKGLDARRPAYDRYAQDLARAGIDAVLFSYFDPEELAVIDGAPDAAARAAEYARSVDRWVSLVRAVATGTREDERSSGNVGLLGFSLGGFVAVAAASQPLFSVLTVFYAGLPTFYHRTIAFLPPLLEIHGARDRSVSPSQGSRLVATAKGLGGVAELTVFPGEGHGFDLDPANRDAALARHRAVAFISDWIGRG